MTVFIDSKILQIIIGNNFFLKKEEVIAYADGSIFEFINTSIYYLCSHYLRQKMLLPVMMTVILGKFWIINL